jgi:excisionase family DNA binding protein
MTERLVYRIPEVCAMMGISARTFWRLVRAGKIDVLKLGSSRFVRHDDLTALLAKPTPRRNPRPSVAQTGTD